MRKILWIVLIVLMSSFSFTINLGPELQGRALQYQNPMVKTEELEEVNEDEEDYSL
jgi:hypothetical protein